MKHKEESPEAAPASEEVRKQKKLAVLESTQMWSPVLDIKDGIIIKKDKQFVKILEFSPINFALYPQEEQLAIAYAFGAAIQSFPDKFQIKIISRESNCDDHVADLKRAQQHEINPFCKKMQEESIKKVRSVRGATKRFFVSFPFEENNRRASWEKVRDSMTTTAYNIVRALASEPCGNTLLSDILDSDAQTEMLYTCMCRSESQTKPIAARVQEVVSRYFEQGKLNSDDLSIPVNEFICPGEIGRSASKYVVVDGKYYAFAYIDGRSYPTSCLPGWLSMLVDLGDGIDLDLFVEKKDSVDIARRLPYAMQLNETKLRHKNESAADIVQLRSMQAAAQYIRSGIAQRQTLCYFSVFLTVTANSAEELKWKFELVENDVTRYGLQFVPLHHRHDLAFTSLLPLCSPDRSLIRKAQRNILSADLGAAYPFTSYAIDDKGGTMIGINLANGSPVYINPFDRSIYSSGNIVILGTTGVGKTYLIQTLALALRSLGIQVVIICPYKGHEYRRACEAVGGQYISLAPGSPQNINIMEIRQYDTSANDKIDGNAAKSSILAAKIQQLHTFIAILKPDITHAERQALDEALTKCYGALGITMRNKSLFDPQNPSKYKKMPTLGDLDRELAALPSGKGIREVLSRFVTGSARSFNSPTNVDLTNPYVVIDISDMPKELIPVGMFIANDFVLDCIKADRTRKKAIINDELSRMIGIDGSPAAAAFVLSNFKIVRAYNAIFVAATQDTNDFFALDGGVYGKGILANAKIKIIMRQEKTEAETVSDILGLSDAEKMNIQYYARGEALLVAARNHAEIRVIASKFEDRLINTDPEKERQRLNL